MSLIIIKTEHLKSHIFLTEVETAQMHTEKSLDSENKYVWNKNKETPAETTNLSDPRL